MVQKNQNFTHVLTPKSQSDVDTIKLSKYITAEFFFLVDFGVGFFFLHLKMKDNAGGWPTASLVTFSFMGAVGSLGSPSHSEQHNDLMEAQENDIDKGCFKLKQI